MPTKAHQPHVELKLLHFVEKKGNVAKMLRWEEEKQGKINTDRSQRVRQFCPPSSLSLTHHSGTVYPVPRGGQGPSHREAKEPRRQDIFLHCAVCSAQPRQQDVIQYPPPHYMDPLSFPLFAFTLCQASGGQLHPHCRYAGSLQQQRQNIPTDARIAHVYSSISSHPPTSLQTHIAF